MRKIPVLAVILLIFSLACSHVSGLSVPNSPDDTDLGGAKEMLENMTPQSEEMLSQSQKEYEEAKYGTDMPYNNLEDLEAAMSQNEQLINAMTDLVDSAVTIVDHITSFTNKISTPMSGGSK